MPVNMQNLIDSFGEQSGGDNAPKRGDDIFKGNDYPRTFEDFIGQDKATEQLEVAIASAKARGVRLEHVLVESGIAGVGKTTIAHIVAYLMEVGLLVTTGPLNVDDFRELLHSCQDNDIVFVDEAHLLVARTRNGADWLLPWMLEGKLITKHGAETVPDVTLIAATTEAGKLPDTLMTRFMVQPEIVHYTSAEAALIAAQLAVRMGVSIETPHAEAIAIAADHNPRLMRRVLTAVRDLSYSPRHAPSHPNLDKAFAYAKVSADGLSLTARDILLVMMRARNLTASLEFIQGQLGEPGPLKQHEQQLLQRGLLTIAAGKGRVLTEPGARRAYLEGQTRMKESA